MKKGSGENGEVGRWRGGEVMHSSNGTSVALPKHLLFWQQSRKTLHAWKILAEDRPVMQGAVVGAYRDRSSEWTWLYNSATSAIRPHTTISRRTKLRKYKGKLKINCQLLVRIFVSRIFLVCIYFGLFISFFLVCLFACLFIYWFVYFLVSLFLLCLFLVFLFC